MTLAKTIKAHSENIAGVVSLAGSVALIFAGNTGSIVAAGTFTAAELTLARFGHKTGGYAAAATLFAAGDLTLAFSGAVQPGSALQLTLAGMATAWTAGALRFPLEKAAAKFNAPKLQKAADILPAICGTTNLALRLPGVFSAAASGNPILAGAITAWGIADVLAGRLQDRVTSIYRAIKGKGARQSPS